SIKSGWYSIRLSIGAGPIIRCRSFRSLLLSDFPVCVLLGCFQFFASLLIQEMEYPATTGDTKETLFPLARPVRKPNFICHVRNHRFWVAALQPFRLCHVTLPLIPEAPRRTADRYGVCWPHATSPAAPVIPPRPPAASSARPGWAAGRRPQ